MLAGVAALVIVPLAATQAVAVLTLANPPSFNNINDENGADDQPGQKDLSSQGVGSNGPGDLWTRWQWDVTSLSGGNTGDACSLFDTDMDNKVNAAVCVTIAGNPAAQATGSPRVYNCGDGKVDRCTSTYTQLPAAQVDTVCATNVNATDPFHAGQKDTEAVCHIDLGDVGGVGTANLVNTCSYPSQEPTSAPSDCVLIPRDAFLRIAKTTDPNPTTQTFDFKLGESTDANPPVVFTATGTQTSNYIPIRSDKKYNVSEVVPANWTINGTPSCTGASGTGSSNGTFAGSTISNVDASPDNQITCTFANKQQQASVKVDKDNDAGSDVSGATFTLYKDDAPTGGSAPGVEDVTAVGSCVTNASGECTISNKPLGEYWLVETGLPTGYSTAAAPKHVTLSTGGATTTVTFTNIRDKADIKIVKKDDGGNLLDSVRFTLKGTSDFGDAVDLSCTTGLNGECPFNSIPLGSYTLDEDVTSIMAGFSKDPSLPMTVNVTTDGATYTINVVNPRSLRVITLVCHEGTVDLVGTDVVNGSTTKTSISAVPAGLAGKGVTLADLCGIGGASFGGLGHTDATFTVKNGSN